MQNYQNYLVSMFSKPKTHGYAIATNTLKIYLDQITGVHVRSLKVTDSSSQQVKKLNKPKDQ